MDQSACVLYINVSNNLKMGSNQSVCCPGCKPDNGAVAMMKLRDTGDDSDLYDLRHELCSRGIYGGDRGIVQSNVVGTKKIIHYNGPIGSGIIEYDGDERTVLMRATSNHLEMLDITVDVHSDHLIFNSERITDFDRVRTELSSRLDKMIVERQLEEDEVNPGLILNLRSEFVNTIDELEQQFKSNLAL